MQKRNFTKFNNYKYPLQTLHEPGRVKSDKISVRLFSKNYKTMWMEAKDLKKYPILRSEDTMLLRFYFSLT